MPQTEQQTMREISAMDEGMTPEQKWSAWNFLMGTLIGMDSREEVPEKVKDAVKQSIQFGQRQPIFTSTKI